MSPNLPLIPLRNMLVFPGNIVPLFVGRASSLKALESATKNEDRQIILVAQKDSQEEDPDTAAVFSVGTRAKVVQILRLPNGTTKALVEGLSRVRIIEQAAAEYRQATAEDMLDEVSYTGELEELVIQLNNKFEAYVKKNNKVPLETLSSIMAVDDPAKLSDLIPTYLSLTLAEKQSLLETPNVLERLQRLQTYCVRETGLLEVEKNLDTTIQSQIEKVQKEYILKEKLKAIQRELGDTSQAYSEKTEYEQRIALAGMPAEVERKALRELARLEKLQPISSESGVIRTYLDWLLDVPWQKVAASPVDIKKVKQALDSEHYGMAQVKDRVIEYLAVLHQSGAQPTTILLLVGPPGVGKTSIAQAIASSLERSFVKISLGGMRDEAELKGHRRTYVGAMPGRFMQALAKVKVTNPLILLDEIDKIAQEAKGDPAAVLLEALDPTQNKQFSDHYLEVTYDLSQVLFVATANSLHNISKPLLDRLEIIQLSGYDEDEKVEIAEQYLLPKLLKRNGLKVKDMEWTTSGIRTVIRRYTREAGLRSLEKVLDEVCRKFVRNRLEGNANFEKISGHNLHHYLGAPKYLDQPDLRSEVGLVNGLAWTETGGEILPVEVTVMPGKGSLTLTGNMGDIMQESARAALSFVRSRCLQLGLKKTFYETADIHIHIQEGAIAKDGPSAGITIAVALASALTGLPARGNVALTGEITLRGKVLPIGGLREKILAAVRSGIETVIIPQDNLRDWEELPARLRRQVKILAVQTMDQVLAQVLLGYKPKQKQVTLEQLDEQPGEELLS